MIIHERNIQATRISNLIAYTFATISFISVTGFFNAFGLVTVAFGVVYSIGSMAIVILFFGKRKEPQNLQLYILIYAFAFPAICFTSTLWSANPEVTLRNSVQLVSTSLFAAYVGSQLGLEGTLRAFGMAMLICVAVSCLNTIVQVVPAWSQNEFVGAQRFLTGVYNQKNGFGYVACLASWAVLHAGMKNGSVTGYFLAYAVAILLGQLLRASGSSTALILYSLVLSMPLLFLLFITVDSIALSMFFSVTITVLLLFLLGLDGRTLPELVLSAVGKDASLTGRTEMWEVAGSYVEQAPFLGVGYQVFWTDPHFSSSVNFIQSIVLETITNFHNAPIEALVGTGIVGTLALLALPTGVLISCIAALKLKRKNKVLVVGTVFLVIIVSIRTGVEANLYFQHQIDFFLMSTLAFSLGSTNDRDRYGDN